jgi:uncharacterized damage-inducible protein DinB
VTNSQFIQQRLLSGEEAKRKVISEFSSLSLPQLNWKPAPDSWSIGQCLDHIIVANSLYFPTLKKITDGNYVASFWEKRSPFTTFFGNFFVKHFQEDVKSKMKTTRVFLPSTSDIGLDVVERFYQHHDTFMGFISKCGQLNLAEIVITSPEFRFVTYNLRDVIQFLVQHEHRHINQAIRVKSALSSK